MTSSGKKRNIDDLEDYDSNFEDDDEDSTDGGGGRREKKAKRKDLAQDAHKFSQPGSSNAHHTAGLPTRRHFEQELGRSDSYKSSYHSLNAFERHRKLINDYFLYHPGAKNLLKRDSSKDKTDRDVIEEHHRFIWEDSDEADTWEKQLSKKYYDKLFKEYAICDLSSYKMGKYAMRWRTEKEVIDGKGQFTCGAKKCDVGDCLRTWEVNFAYMESSVKKNALVKLRLCSECSVKLNYHQKRKEVTKVSKQKKKKRDKSSKSSGDFKVNAEDTSNLDDRKRDVESKEKKAENIWKDPVQVADVKTREEEFDDYLDDLFL